jgi:hypothetical protein
MQNESKVGSIVIGTLSYCHIAQVVADYKSIGQYGDFGRYQEEGTDQRLQERWSGMASPKASLRSSYLL